MIFREKDHSIWQSIRPLHIALCLLTSLFVVWVLSVGLPPDPSFESKKIDPATAPVSSSFIPPIAPEPRPGKSIIYLGETAVYVEYADTNEKRVRGLSGRKALPYDEGLYFIFDEEDIHGIWMKDMNFSIDIIWVSKEGLIVGLEENASPESYPKVFSPDSPALFVIEVNAGFVEKNKIRMGDLLAR